MAHLSYEKSFARTYLGIETQWTGIDVVPYHARHISTRDAKFQIIIVTSMSRLPHPYIIYRRNHDLCHFSDVKKACICRSEKPGRISATSMR
jgi:hypothetical protein